ncbi:putative transcription factor interactor and regulator CCHC(Zn) family [Helianthus debilis subsp. tardiflorus]
MYYGVPSSSSINASSDIATAFLSHECGASKIVTEVDGEVCFFIASGGSTKGKRQQASNHSSSTMSIPLRVKATEEYLALLASFVASYENYIQGRISDVATFDEDYDQIDPDDLEEMDLQWKMAMISRRVKRFMNRTRRKFVGKNIGVDKSKVRCYTCPNFGHFARECQRPKAEFRPNSSFQDSLGQGSSNGNASNSNGSRALISTTREGSYDQSVPLEADGNITQAFMAEIATVDDAEEKVDVEVEKETEFEKVDADQTEVPENEIKSDEKKDAEEKKKATEFVAFMADLSKATGVVNSNLVSSVCLKCAELEREVNRLSKHNLSLINDLSSLKESNFFVKRNESLYLKKIKGYETEINILTCKLNEKTSNN